MRRALQRAAVNDLTRSDWRVLGAVLTLTASYSRTADFVYVADVARAAGLKNERNVRAAIGRLTKFGVIEWDAGRGRAAPSLLSLPEKGKGGPTVVRLSKEENRSPSGQDFRENLGIKPVPRKAAIRGTDTREEVREEKPAGSGRSKTTGPAWLERENWTCDVVLKDGDVCGSSFGSEEQLARHKLEHWSGDAGALSASLLREILP
jgi:hypothetical protein